MQSVLWNLSLSFSLLLALLSAPSNAQTQCQGCKAQYDPSAPLGSAQETVVWFTVNPDTGESEISNTLTLFASITIYGTTCEEVAPLVCQHDKNCPLYAALSYSSTVQVNAARIKPSEGAEVTLGGPANPTTFPPVAGPRQIWGRSDDIDCGFSTYAIFFLDATAPGLFAGSEGPLPQTATVTLAYGCSQCKLGDGTVGGL